MIFIDLNMPRKNGFECLKEIKHSQKFKNIPVVIFSKSSQQDVYSPGSSLLHLQTEFIFELEKRNNASSLRQLE